MACERRKTPNSLSRTLSLSLSPSLSLSLYLSLPSATIGRYLDVKILGQYLALPYALQRGQDLERLQQGRGLERGIVESVVSIRRGAAIRPISYSGGRDSLSLSLSVSLSLSLSL